jgi:uncharacterized membrane protein
MIATESHVDVQRMGALVLKDYYGVTVPDNLTSAERHQAYEVIKDRVRRAARSEEQYQQNIKKIVEFLEI